MTTDWLSKLRAAVLDEMELATALRQKLHAHPRASGDEGPTRDLVLAALPHGDRARPSASTGAVLRIGPQGPAIAVRAELDAIGVDEATGVGWTSTTPGLMHACGHDVHLAATVALARAVDRVGGPAPLLVVLQPREETYPSGASDVIAEGTLAVEECGAVIGAHVQPTLPVGHVACTPGVVNASSDEFTITVRGMGGHAAYPHLGADPVLALSHIVVALQTLISRRTDPMASVVLSVTMLEAGAAANVIPSRAVARGTLRSLDVKHREMLLQSMHDVVVLVAEAHGCAAEVVVTRGEPPLLNDHELTGATQGLLGELGVEVADALRSAGSDDFAFYTEIWPSLMMFVGTDTPGEILHSATFLPADDAVADVAFAMLAGYLAAAGHLPLEKL